MRQQEKTNEKKKLTFQNLYYAIVIVMKNREKLRELIYRCEFDFSFFLYLKIYVFIKENKSFSFCQAHVKSCSRKA